MIKEILQIFQRPEDEARASFEDYEEVFSSEAGQRVLLDIMVRYRVGQSSFSFDRSGQVNLEASARSDAAKVIVMDLAKRGKLKVNTADKPSRAPQRDKVQKLPSAATHV